MPGAQCTRSLACKIKKAHEHSHHGHTGITRHSLRNGFNGFLRALPGDRACLSPSSALLLADLTPAPRRTSHTTSPPAPRLRQRLRRGLSPVRRSFSEGGSSALVFSAACV